MKNNGDNGDNVHLHVRWRWCLTVDVRDSRKIIMIKDC
jgi:hypothetical protein